MKLIVIPTYNERENLAEWLALIYWQARGIDTLFRQSYVVSDWMSSIGFSIVRNFRLNDFDYSLPYGQ